MDAPTDQLVAYLTENRKALLGFIRSKVGDEALAEDVLQESLLRALRHAPDLRDEEKLAAWLYRIVRNAITDAYRRHATARDARARFSAEQEATAALAPTPEDEAQLCACVLGLVPTLKPEYAAVVEADLAGRDAEALAAELGITRNNLKVRRHRAHRQLRERLEQTCRLCATHGCLDCSCRAPVNDGGIEASEGNLKGI